MKFITIAFFVAFFAKIVSANSYLEMITTPPKGEVTVQENVMSASLGTPTRLRYWNEESAKTSSPVVTSPYPKYKAWFRSERRPNFIEYTHDELQHLVYMIEGGLLGLWIYKLYSGD